MLIFIIRHLFFINLPIKLNQPTPILVNSPISFGFKYLRDHLKVEC